MRALYFFLDPFRFRLTPQHLGRTATIPRQNRRTMKTETINIIRSVLKGDRTATDEQIEQVLQACRQNNPQRKLISAQQAMRILDVSRPTLRTYAQKGLLHQIDFSPRRARFVEEEVYELAYNGSPIGQLLYV